MYVEKQQDTKVSLIASASSPHCATSLLPPSKRLYSRLAGEVGRVARHRRHL